MSTSPDRLMQRPPRPDAAEETPRRKPRSAWLRLFLVVAAFVVVLVVAGTVHNGFQQARSTSRMQRLLAQMEEDDPNWKIEDIQRTRIDPPESKNSARVVVALKRLLPRDWPRQEFYEAFDDLQAPHLLRPEQQRLLEQQLAALDPAVQLGRRLADMPTGRHHLEFSDNFFATLLNDQQETRRAAQLMNYDSLLLGQKGDVAAALRSARGVLNAGRSLYDEPLTISQLIRTACVAISLNTMERALAMGEAPDAALAELYKALVDEEKHPSLLAAARGERAGQHVILSKIISGQIDAKEVFGPEAVGTDFLGIKARFMGFSRDNARREYPIVMEQMTRYVDAARLPVHEQREAIAAVDADVHGRNSPRTLARMLLPAMVKVSESFQRKVAQVMCLRVLVAVERYRLANKKWPARLADLPKDLLDSVPIDPYDGKPIRFRRLTDGVIVYSVGFDRTDDGGNLDRKRIMEKGVDMGFRLWDVEKRRQPPLPAPPPKQGLPGGPGQP